MMGRPVEGWDRYRAAERLRRFKGWLFKGVSKIQFELVCSDLKQARGAKARTICQVGVDAADTGDAQDNARWKECVADSLGKRSLAISPAIGDTYPAHETAGLSNDELA